MDHPVDLIGRFSMRRGVRCLEAAALVDGYVNEDGTLLDAGKHLARDQFRSRSARNKHRPNNDVGGEALFLKRLYGGVARMDATVENVVELAKTRNRAIENCHVGAKPGRHLRRMQ